MSYLKQLITANNNKIHKILLMTIKKRKLPFIKHCSRFLSYNHLCEIGTVFLPVVLSVARLGYPKEHT